MQKIIILFVLFLTLFSKNSFTATIQIDEDFDYLDISKNIEVIKKTPYIKVNNIIDGSIRYDFKENTQGKISYGYDLNTYLAQFKVKNTTNKPQKVYLSNYSIPNLNLYIIDNNRLLSAFKWDFYQGELPENRKHRFPIIPINLKAEQTLRVLVEYSSNYALIFNPELVSEKTELYSYLFDTLFYKIYYGIFTALILGFLFLALVYKKPLFLLYSGFILSTTMFNVFYLNHAYLIHGIYNRDYFISIFVFFICTGLILGTQAVCLLLNIKETMPKIYGFIAKFYVLIVISIMLLLVFGSDQARKLILFELVVMNILLMIMMFKSLRNRLPYSSIAFIVVIYQISIILVHSAWFGFIRFSINYMYFYSAITVIETLWLSSLISLKMLSNYKKPI